MIKTVRIRVPVKRKHIMKGEAGEGEMCAIALAVGEVCGPDKAVSVSDEISIGDLTLSTPEKGRRFIRKFDHIGDAPYENDFLTRKEYLAALAKWKAARMKLKPFVLDLDVPLCELL